MKHVFVLLTCIVPLLATQARGDQGTDRAKEASGSDQIDERYQSLFDGETLDGWQLRRANRNGYIVENGMLVCPADGGGYLFTRRQFSDFSFRFQFRLSKGANNGIAVRCPLLDKRPAYDGIEIQILDNSHARDGLRPTQMHGSVYDVVPAKVGALKPLGQWNEQEIICRGSQLTVIVNGITIVDADLSQVADSVQAAHPGLRRRKGHIGLIGHNSRVEFRDLRIRELD